MMIEKMSDRQLMGKMKNLQNAISNMYKTSFMLTGEMAILGVEQDICRAEYDLECCYREFNKRKDRPKSTDILLEKWREN